MLSSLDDAFHYKRDSIIEISAGSFFCEERIRPDITVFMIQAAANAAKADSIRVSGIETVSKMSEWPATVWPE